MDRHLEFVAGLNTLRAVAFDLKVFCTVLAGKNPVEAAAGRRRMRKEQAMPGIVVGIDGSANSERALDWAMGHAAALHAPLTVIAVHEVPKSYWGHIPVTGPPDVPVLAALRVAAEDMTRKAASRLGDAGPPSVNVRALSGFVVQQLVDASQDADLVILGQRAGNGMARLVMGSVSSEVVQHSACPVVLVPHARR